MIEQEFASFVGNTETATDQIDAWHANALQATLYPDAPALPDGAPIPPSAHWLYFRAVAPSNKIGRDGHAAKGEFLPPIDLPRRMWAGGRLRVIAPLRIGDKATKTSTIESISAKQGSTGPLAIVTVRYDMAVDGDLRLTEHHDIIYREDPKQDAPPPRMLEAPEEAGKTVDISPDPVLLFRYSALTFNSHRIHYDADYVRDVEGYPGLIVHGPLLATWLIDLAADLKGGERPSAFEFRAVAPTFGHEKIQARGTLRGSEADLWIAGSESDLRMKATARWNGG